MSGSIYFYHPRAHKLYSLLRPTVLFYKIIHINKNYKNCLIESFDKKIDCLFIIIILDGIKRSFTFLPAFFLIWFYARGKAVHWFPRGNCLYSTRMMTLLSVLRSMITNNLCLCLFWIICLQATEIDLAIFSKIIYWKDMV